MKGHHTLFSSLSPHWATPDALYRSLDAEFHFTLDPCPLHGVGMSLMRTWEHERVFCNPPYGPEIVKWLSKATIADIAVFLLPARTDTSWFHNLVLSQAREIRFIRGRLKFSGAKYNAPFPSMVVIYQ